MKKKILVLGNNLYQLNLINEINKKNKYDTYVLSNKYQNKSKFIKKFYTIDIKNYKKVLNIFKKKNFSKVISIGSDVPLKTIGYINTKLNLGGLKFKDSIIATEKNSMKKFFSKIKISQPKFKLYNGRNLLKEIRIKTPTILKETSSSGSRGIYKIENQKKFLNIRNQISNNKKYIVEDLIIGKEFGANIIFYKNKIQNIFIFDDIVFDNGNTNVPIGHIFPNKNLEKFRTKINKIANKIIKNLNIKNGFLNLDLIFDKKKRKLFLIEFSTRLGATGIPELFNFSHNDNLFDKIIEIDNISKKLNFKNDNKSEKKFYLSLLAISKKKGFLKKIEINRNLRKFCLFKSFLPIGSKIEKFDTGNNMLGYAIFRFNNKTYLNKNINNYFNIKITK